MTKRQMWESKNQTWPERLPLHKRMTRSSSARPLTPNPLPLLALLDKLSRLAKSL